MLCVMPEAQVWGLWWITYWSFLSTVYAKAGGRHTSTARPVIIRPYVRKGEKIISGEFGAAEEDSGTEDYY